MDRRAGKILVSFLAVKNILKIYHFQTPSYARHKRSDKLFEQLTDKIDTFMEVLQGAWDVRVKFDTRETIPLYNVDDTSIIIVLREFIVWLTDDLPTLLREKDTDLLNIRDEILGDVNQTLYLFTFK